MHDPGTSMFLQKRLRQQSDNVVAFDKPTRCIEEEAAIEVPIPGDAQIGVVRPDRIDGGLTVFNQQWIRHTIGEVTIGVMMNLDELERQLWFQQVDDRPCAAIAGRGRP